jgi:hypothetical protein
MRISLFGIGYQNGRATVNRGSHPRPERNIVMADKILFDTDEVFALLRELRNEVRKENQFINDWLMKTLSRQEAIQKTLQEMQTDIATIKADTAEMKAARLAWIESRRDQIERK